eukprot:720913-Pyramimonas_sp.AAC.1
MSNFDFSWTCRSWWQAHCPAKRSGSLSRHIRMRILVLDSPTLPLLGCRTTWAVMRRLGAGVEHGRSSYLPA